MSYPHPLSLPLSGMTTIFLLFLWKSFPSFKAQHSCNLLQEALPDCLTGNQVVTMEENSGEESCIRGEEMPWEPETRAQQMQPVFLTSFPQWAEVGSTRAERAQEMVSGVPSGHPRALSWLREGQLCSHLYLHGDRAVTCIAKTKPSSHHLWMRCPQWPPRQWLIPRATGCILLISACFPMVGEGGVTGGWGEKGDRDVTSGLSFSPRFQGRG